MAKERCVFTKADGERCQVRFGIGTDGRCFAHSTVPDRIKKQNEGRKRGGHTTNMGKAVMASELPPLPKAHAENGDFLRWIMGAHATGKIDARRAHELTLTARELGRTFDKIDLEERVKELEARLAEAQADRKPRAIR